MTTAYADRALSGVVTHRTSATASSAAAESRGRILSPSSCTPRRRRRPARRRQQPPPRRSPRAVELFPDLSTLPRATSRERARNPRKDSFPYFLRPARPTPTGPTAPATDSPHTAESRGRILSPTCRRFPAQLPEKRHETHGRVLSPTSRAPRGAAPTGPTAPATHLLDAPRAPSNSSPTLQRFPARMR